MKIYFWIGLLTGFVLSCQKQDEAAYVAKVGDLVISQQEFNHQYQFNPYLTQYPNPRQARKIILNTLIADKLLAQEGREKFTLSDTVQKMIDHHLKESMIENYRIDRVESTIRISDLELQEEYDRSLRQLRINYIAFETIEEAWKARAQIEKGSTFDETIQQYMSEMGWKEAIPERNVNWGEESPELEEQLYALAPGQVSQPVLTHGGYFLIRLIDRKRTAEGSPADFSARRPALQDRIRRRKIKAEYTLLFHDKIEPRLGAVDANRLNYLAEELIQANADIFPNLSGNLNNQRGLLQEIYQGVSHLDGIDPEQEIVRFPYGGAWTVRGLLDELKYGPYAFSYESAQQFKKSLIKNTHLAMEFQAVYTLAEDAGYKNDSRVSEEFRIWNNYYLAQNFRYQLLQNAEKGGELSELKSGNTKEKDSIKYSRSIFMDNYLCNLLEKYDIDVKKEVFRKLKLDKSQIVLMKSHFANRLVYPLLEPLDGLPKWTQKMDSLNRKWGIG